MIRLIETKKAEKLFGDWQEALVWSCLQNVMGEIYVENLEEPQSAMAILGDFCFFAGKPNQEMVLYKPQWCKQDFIIMIPQNHQWAVLIADSYGRKAKAVTRYGIKKEDGIFDKNQLKEAVKSLEPEYELKRIDRHCFDLCRSNDWSRDLVSQFKDYAMYSRLGLGVAALKDGELVSGASSYARYKTGIEIEIDTKKEYRRKGLAYGCGAKLILECLEQGLYPSWDAQNKSSAALAQKLGYHYDHAYSAYEIWEY